MDVDAEKAFEEMIQLLVAAGYFRARVCLYSAFDRIVGGMVWCILNCSVRVDTPLLFQRNLNIKQKLSLGESVVSALVEMKCPHPVEPHQIHGLDLVNIFPVLQWLVKNAMESRDITAQSTRNLALLHFDRNYSPGACREVRHSLPTPLRFYRQTETSRDRPIKVRLARTLREFFEEGREEEPEEEEGRDLVEVDVGQTPSVSAVSQLVLGQSEAIRAVDEEFAARQGELRSVGRRRGNMREEANLLGGRVNELIGLRDAAQEDLRCVMRRVEKVRRKASRCRGEVEALQRGSGELSTLLAGQDELELVNRAIKELRVECNEESARMRGHAGELRGRVGQVTSDRPQLEERAGKLRMGLAKKIRGVASLERRMDQQLSGGEVSQYSRRFMELEEEMSISLRDTTQILLEKNTKASVIESIGGEVEVLESIIRIFTEGLKSASTRAFFAGELRRVEGTTEGMLGRATADMELTMEGWREANLRFLKLLDEDRTYRLVLRKFSDECARNTKLNARLSKI